MYNNQESTKEDKLLKRSVEKQQEQWIEQKKKEKSKIDYKKGFTEDDGEMSDEYDE